MADTNAASARAELSRREFLRASVGGAVGLAGWSLLTGHAAATTAFAQQTGSNHTSGPASMLVRLNADWLFGGQWVAGSSQPAFDDSGFAPVTVPHCVSALSWRNWNPGTWEKLWIYRRHFDLPPATRTMRAFVDFAGVLTSATPTINGHALPEHKGGYLPFDYELTDYVGAKDNVLAVKVDSTWQNVPPEGNPAGPDSIDYFEPGGIYRDVTLRFVPQVFLSDIFAKPIHVLSSSPAVQVQCTVDSAVVPSSSLKVVVELLDGERRLARASAPVPLDKPGQATVSLTLAGFGRPQLWDNANPKLYQVLATVYLGNHPIHDFSRRIGFREAVFTTDGFFLNGKRLKLFGLDRHQIYAYTGMAMPARVQRHDAELLKKLNCNMVRMSHYPQHPAFLDACDELGIMLWEETPGWGYLGDAAWQAIMLQNVHDMVVRDRSRPSVIIWGVQPNETPHDHVSLWTESKDLADSLDGSRPVSGTSWYGLQYFVFNVMAHDDYSHSDGNAELLPPFTGVPYLVTEAVGAIDGSLHYQWVDTQSIQMEQARMHAQVHNIAGSEDAYCGLLGWSGLDYESPDGIPHSELIKWTGVADIFRVPKPGAAFYLAQGDPSAGAVIEPAFYWDFGPASPVTTLGANAEIWSNCDRLEAYLDGSHYATLTPATAQTSEGLHQGYPYLPHAPFYLDTTGTDASAFPDLRLDGYVGDRLVLSRSFSADTSGDHLEVVVDDTELVADGSDATRVAFRAVDRYGAPRPYVTGNVTVEVRGPATWVSQVLTFEPTASPALVPLGGQTKVALTLSNGTFPFQSNGGVGGVWIRTLLDQPGEITVTVSHPTLGTYTAHIHSAEPPSSALFEFPRPRVPVDPVAAMTFTDVALDLEATSAWGIQASGQTAFSKVPPGTTVKATWEVSAPTATTTAAGSITATASFSLVGSPVTHSSPVPVSLLETLAQAFDNVGITDNSDVTVGNFDGVGNSFSAQALAAAGLTPGAPFTHDGISFVWPDVPGGKPDNVLANGQAIVVSGSGSKLAFVGASSPGNEGGTGTVYYTDGTTSTYDVTLDNYFYPPGTGNDTLVETPYINSGTGYANGGVIGRRNHPGWIFYTWVPITPGKTVKVVTLPTGGGMQGGRIVGMHVFAMAVG